MHRGHIVTDLFDGSGAFCVTCQEPVNAQVSDLCRPDDATDKGAEIERNVTVGVVGYNINANVDRAAWGRDLARRTCLERADELDHRAATRSF